MMATSPLVSLPDARLSETKENKREGKEKMAGKDLQGRECKTNGDTCKENAEYKNIIQGGCSILPFELRI